MGKRSHLLLQVAKLLCGELRGSLPNLSHPGHWAAHAGWATCPASPSPAHSFLCPPVPPQQFWQTGNFTSTLASLASFLNSEEKLAAFLFIVALHQVLSFLCTSALSLLLVLPTRNTERVLCFTVELSPNLAHCGLDKTCQIFSCCSSPPWRPGGLC